MRRTHAQHRAAAAAQTRSNPKARCAAQLVARLPRKCSNASTRACHQGLRGTYTGWVHSFVLHSKGVCCAHNCRLKAAAQLLSPRTGTGLCLSQLSTVHTCTPAEHTHMLLSHAACCNAHTHTHAHTPTPTRALAALAKKRLLQKLKRPLLLLTGHNTTPPLRPQHVAGPCKAMYACSLAYQVGLDTTAACNNKQPSAAARVQPRVLPSSPEQGAASCTIRSDCMCPMSVKPSTPSPGDLAPVGASTGSMRAGRRADTTCITNTTPDSPARAAASVTAAAAARQRPECHHVAGIAGHSPPLLPARLCCLCGPNSAECTNRAEEMCDHS